MLLAQPSYGLPACTVLHYVLVIGGASRTRIRKPRQVEHIPESFGGKFKLWRSVRGLRQGDVARYLGKDRTTIARWETDEVVPSDIRLIVLALRHYDCLHDGLGFSPFGSDGNHQ